MKKVIILGGDSTLGQIIARQLLTSGFQVSVFADGENDFKIVHHNYTYIKGDVFNIYSVSDAIKSHQAVISLYSYYHLWKLFYLRDAIQNIIKAMNEHKASRLVFFSFGEKALPQFKGDGENVVIKNIFSMSYEKSAKNTLENIVRKSSLNFTINTFDDTFLRHYKEEEVPIKQYYHQIADLVQKQIFLDNNHDRELQLRSSKALEQA